MADADTQKFAYVFPADDEAGDARWLTGLMAALQIHARMQGHAEVAAALTDALNAAQAVVDGGGSADSPERDETSILREKP